jgi:monofunctional glycosyltransferase
MKNILSKLFKILKWCTLIFFILSVFSVIFFRFVPPPFTPLMINRFIWKKDEKVQRRILKDWVPIEKISPNLVLAVVSAEDNNFTKHNGIDFEAIEKARLLNKKTKRIHGASTISQQTAKNLFLWPSRTYIRKGFELYFTFLIEVFWSKERIMEMYLNIVEMGNGIYGAEAASKYYFHKHALQLTRNEAAMLAAVLPNPINRNPVRPGPYLRWYQARILYLMSMIEKVEL